FVFRFHRQTERIRQLLDEGTIGRVLHTDAQFHVGYPADPQNIRLRPEVGGGALMDLGCYTLQWSQFVMGEAPTRVAAHWYPTPTGVDQSTVATLAFSDGRTANVACAF